MTRTFEVVDKLTRTTYSGFDGVVKTADKVAIVQVEDTYEIWALDNNESFGALYKFLNNHYEGIWKLVGIFNKDMG